MTASRRLAVLLLFALWNAAGSVAGQQPVAPRAAPPTQEPPLAPAVPAPSMPPPVIPAPAPVSPAQPPVIPAQTPMRAVPVVPRVGVPVPAKPQAAGEGGSRCPVDPPTPVVKLRVRVPASVGAGQEIEYRLCLENCSKADAHHVIVRNPVPASARFVRAEPAPSTREPELTWQLGTLAAGACREIVLVLAPTGDGDVGNCARVQFEHGECVTTRVTRPSLSLKKCGPTSAVLYDSVNFQLVVTNTGGAPATGVVVTDTLPEGLETPGGKNPLTWELGTLAPGQCQQLEYQAIVKKGGRLCNKAVAVAAGGALREAESCVTVGEARIDLEKRGPEQRFVTRPATYQITVGNPGSSPAGNVTITDLLPANATFVSASNGGRLNGNQVQWAVGTLPPGARRTVQVTLQAKEVGEVVNQATATADRGLSARAEARTLFSAATGLTADVEVKDNPLEVGAETSYVVTVLNQGPVPATKVQVVATVPAQMAFVSAKGPTNFRQEGAQVVFEELATLPSRGEIHYEIRVKAVREGDVRFKVLLLADELKAGPVQREESTTIYADTAPPPATRLEPPQSIVPHSTAPPVAPLTPVPAAPPPMAPIAPAPVSPPPTAEPPPAPLAPAPTIQP